MVCISGNSRGSARPGLSSPTHAGSGGGVPAGENDRLHSTSNPCYCCAVLAGRVLGLGCLQIASSPDPPLGGRRKAGARARAWDPHARIQRKPPGRRSELRRLGKQAGKTPALAWSSLARAGAARGRIWVAPHLASQRLKGRSNNSREAPQCGDRTGDHKCIENRCIHRIRGAHW
jgi:hypothetical protein